MRTYQSQTDSASSYVSRVVVIVAGLFDSVV